MIGVEKIKSTITLKVTIDYTGSLEGSKKELARHIKGLDCCSASVKNKEGNYWVIVDKVEVE